MVTFVIPCHNEAGSVSTIVTDALAAARDGDRVLVVDSASTDDTAAVAAGMGVEVLSGPLGKGRAMTAALRTVESGWVCFLDADTRYRDRNQAAELRAAIEASDADHILGDYLDVPPGVVLSNTHCVYERLLSALFPEAHRAFGYQALTGFRAIRREAITEELPPDYGVETFLNITLLMRGLRHEVVSIGRRESRFRYHATMTYEISKMVFDLAERFGRLDPAQRPEWEAWVARVGAVITGFDGDPVCQPGYLRDLFTAAAEPLPPAVEAPASGDAALLAL